MVNPREERNERAAKKKTTFISQIGIFSSESRSSYGAFHGINFFRYFLFTKAARLPSHQAGLRNAP
jgi:hypothetical protein